MYIDTHAHLCDPILIDRTESIINDLEKENIKFIIEASYDNESSRLNCDMARLNDKVYAMVGIHPNSATKVTNEDLSEIEELAKRKKVVAIGEIGLDFYYTKNDETSQVEIFEKQLLIADRCKLPVCLHVRDAYEKTFKVLKKNKNLLNHGLLFHCYSGSAEYMNEVIKEFENVFFAFGGVVTFKNNANVIRSLENCPIDKLLIETDCPYLTPVPFRGQVPNEPKFVKLVYDKVSVVKQISFEKLQEIVEENVNRLYFKK